MPPQQTRNAANAATLKRSASCDHFVAQSLRSLGQPDRRWRQVNFTSAATRKSCAIEQIRNGATVRENDATLRGINAQVRENDARGRKIHAQRRRNDAGRRETKKPTKGELFMFRLLVSRSATSLHLHSEKEGIGLFAVLHFRLNGELHITVLWCCCIHIHII